MLSYFLAYGGVGIHAWDCRIQNMIICVYTLIEQKLAVFTCKDFGVSKESLFNVKRHKH